MSHSNKITLFLVVFTSLIGGSQLSAQVAIHGETIYTMAGDPIKDGVVVVRDGKISAIGRADAIKIPEGFRLLNAKIVTPGLVDAHTSVGLSGMFNQEEDQDQFDRSEPIQPELRAVDAYNSQEDLIAWVRSFGVTTIHTGHAPGELISGQTMIVKTTGTTVEEAALFEARAVAATLSSLARKSDSKSPGTRGKMVSMLRSELIRAQEYTDKLSSTENADDDQEKTPPPRDLRLETLAKVLSGEMPLMVTANRTQDIASALRLAKEFDITIWLDGAAEAYRLTEEILAAGVPVLIHPTMARPTSDLSNLSFETASKLVEAGIPVALQSGYEAYVPKTRVVLFEAGMAAANGLTFEQALATITIDAARILGIQERVGSLEVGKDGDLAMYDGDPFEYTSHCTGVIINGQVVSDSKQ
ncbi:MAG: amidohydrolase family protein [Rubripirellula sp.]|nr:amidohydrolase family protein [Rubripirellula sp.]